MRKNSGGEVRVDFKFHKINGPERGAMASIDRRPSSDSVGDTSSWRRSNSQRYGSRLAIDADLRRSWPSRSDAEVVENYVRHTW